MAIVYVGRLNDTEWRVKLPDIDSKLIVSGHDPEFKKKMDAGIVGFATGTMALAYMTDSLVIRQAAAEVFYYSVSYLFARMTYEVFKSELRNWRKYLDAQKIKTPSRL